MAKQVIWGAVTSAQAGLHNAGEAAVVRIDMICCVLCCLQAGLLATKALRLTARVGTGTNHHRPTGARYTRPAGIGLNSQGAIAAHVVASSLHAGIAVLTVPARQVRLNVEQGGLLRCAQQPFS